MDDVAKIVMAGFKILLIISISCAELTGTSTVVIRDLKATVSTLNTVPCTLYPGAEEMGVLSMHCCPNQGC